MQLVTWEKYYEQNKNNITDKQAAYERFLKQQKNFIESTSPFPKSSQNSNETKINYNYYGNQKHSQ